MNKTHYRLIFPRNIRYDCGRSEKKKKERNIFLNLKRENPLQRVRATIIYSLASDASVSFAAVFLSQPHKRIDIYAVNMYPGGDHKFCAIQLRRTSTSPDVIKMVVVIEL